MRKRNTDPSRSQAAALSTHGRWPSKVGLYPARGRATAPGGAGAAPPMTAADGKPVVRRPQATAGQVRG